jgi:serine/threonine protein kinase/WD40 repeat protein
MLEGGREPVEELAEEFLARYRRGERPALTEYTQKRPELAEEIRELFPALVMMEEAGPRQDGRAAFGGKITADGQALRQLGEYRILREVGRGGMGVVYEAEQEALGRHVALKVLPFDAAADSTCLKRFGREARSTARLHHTNIVPVFDVGEHDGVHYYAMQFIQGQGLDEVLGELRRLRLGQASLPAGELSRSLAESVITGQFALSAEASGEQQPRDDRVTAENDTSTKGLPPRPSETSIRARSRSAGLMDDSVTSSAHSDFRYYRSVARLGLPVAEALAHAHGQKVLHRDIKPSNLLLDLYGRVWVTDFGLAKEEGDDLTRVGDVVGTLRYMVPERFNGRSDARGDIYSLGLTLYELLTLRPAFEETDRARLIRRISQQEPDPPRKLDRRVPRDLETIVLKAIAKEPNRRYATADALAEDLRRFLADRPILARRTSYAGYAWRWVRRNPGWAATLAATLLLLMVGAVGGTVQNFYLQKSLTATQNAERDKTDKLWRSYLEQARAERSSGRIGQRFASLKAIREAARIRITPELRDEAIAALALPDVELVRELEPFPEGSLHFAFDADFKRYVRLDKDGGLTVLQLTDTGQEEVARLPAHGEPPFLGPWMSPDGRFAAYGYGFTDQSRSGWFRVWQVDGPGAGVRLDDPVGVHEGAVAFRANGRQVAVGHATGSVSIYDMDTGRCCRRLQLGIAPQVLAFHPVEGRLACACANTVRIFDVDTGRELRSLRHPEGVTSITGLAWHPDGRRLASGCNDRRIHVWDTANATEVMTPWSGETDFGILLDFNHRGDRVLSVGWAGQTRLWDAATGRLMLTLPGFWARFAADDRVFGWQASSRPAIWRLAAARELQVLRRRDAAPGETLYHPIVHNDGRVVAASVDDVSNSVQARTWLSFFDLDGGEEAASVPVVAEGARRLCRDPSGAWITGGAAGVLIWPAGPDKSQPNRMQVGPPELLLASPGTGVSASQDGRVIVVAQGSQAVALHRGPPRRRVVLGPQYDVRSTAVSPDGRWAVTCSHWWDGRSRTARVWDAHTGELVRDFPLATSTVAAFSPDGRWLVTRAVGAHAQFWQVGTWRPGLQLAPGYGIAFTADARLVASSDAGAASNTIKLVEVATGREVLRLASPEPSACEPACFTPDGSRLIATCTGGQGLYVWNLGLIRQGLEELGLAENWPESLSGPCVPRSTAPLTVSVDAGRARLAANFKDDRLAVAVYTLALAACPLNPEMHLERGRAYGRLNERRKAVADYSGYLALAGTADDRRPEVLLRRAANFERLGNYEAALADLRPFVAIAVDDAELPTQTALLCNAVAWHYVKEKKNLPTDIVALARRAAELQPFNAAHQNTLGAALYRAGAYPESINCLQRNLSANRAASAYDMYFLAMNCQRLGRPDKARDYFNQANAWWQEHPNLPATDAAELTVFKNEAAALLGIR